MHVPAPAAPRRDGGIPRSPPGLCPRAMFEQFITSSSSPPHLLTSFSSPPPHLLTSFSSPHLLPPARLISTSSSSPTPHHLLPRSSSSLPPPHLPLTSSSPPPASPVSQEVIENNYFRKSASGAKAYHNFDEEEFKGLLAPAALAIPSLTLPPTHPTLLSHSASTATIPVEVIFAFKTFKQPHVRQTGAQTLVRSCASRACFLRSLLPSVAAPCTAAVCRL